MAYRMEIVVADEASHGRIESVRREPHFEPGRKSLPFSGARKGLIHAVMSSQFYVLPWFFIDKGEIHILISGRF